MNFITFPYISHCIIYSRWHFNTNTLFINYLLTWVLQIAIQLINKLLDKTFLGFVIFNVIYDSTLQYLLQLVVLRYSNKEQLALHTLQHNTHSIAGLLCPSWCLCGTILVTPCLMVWDWRVSTAGPMLFYWPSCSLPFCLLLFSLSLLSFYGLVLWGWGLWTDRVLIALSQPCNANLF